MKINTLVSTLNMDEKLYQKQNTKGEVIVINQCDTSGFEIKEDIDKVTKIYSFNERGIGKSRNTAILRSDADISILADDDEIFLDNYLEIVESSYANYPDADLILFDVLLIEEEQILNKKIKKSHVVTLFNSLKYGAVNITFRNESIRKGDIFFSNNFGGGASFGSGEDSKFIVDCLKKNMKIYAVDKHIANLTSDRPSTWFKGYDKNFFYDKGALFSAFDLKLGFIYGLITFHKSFLNKGNLTYTEKLSSFIKGYINYQKLYK